METNKNWFSDNFMLKLYSERFDVACDTFYKGKNRKLLKACKSPNEFSADYIRISTCAFYIARDWPSELLETYTEEIQDECKRLYYTYNDSEVLEKSIPQGLGNRYVAFAKGKRLPFYDGNYVNGLKSGFGTYYYKNGNRYTGNYKNGKEHGRGKYKWKSGHLYEGEYLNGLRHGKGILTFASKDKFEGDFLNGRYHGIGTYYDYYEGKYLGKVVGEWVDGLLNGEGVKFNQNGERYEEGIFENNKLIKSQKVNLKQLLKSKKDLKVKDNHDKCLKAADYKGCMNYQN